MRKKNAKMVKTAMEKLKFLDKRFRMTPVSPPADDGKEISVPVNDAFLRIQDDDTALKDHASWVSLLEGRGKQEMPFSSSQFAKAKQNATK